MSDLRLSQVEMKAVALVAEGHVGVEVPDVRVFPVRSHHGSKSFTVVVCASEPVRSSCDCPAGAVGRRCSHLIACELVIEREARGLQVAA